MKILFVAGYLQAISIGLVSGFLKPRIPEGTSSRGLSSSFASREEVFRLFNHPEEISKSMSEETLSTEPVASTTMPAPSSEGTFDEEAFEKDRLSKDQEAMDAMKAKAEDEFSSLRTPWKWVIRKRIWDLMEEKDIARFPRPVHHRIPNFVGAEQAASRLRTLPEFETAKCVKVNPDTPQRPVRHAVLESKKTLLTPQPRLRTGFFSTLNMDDIRSANPSVKIEQCTNSKGVAKFGTPVSLNDEYTVDLVVVGSTAVCPNTGARVGKGEGFAELEWGILSLQGNLDASKTLVVTTVHDEQVVNDIPPGQLTKHDVPVDIIVTPTRIIRVPNRVPKPSGVYWDLLSPQKLGQIRVLRQLKQEIEKRDNIKLPSGPDEKLPPTASRNKKSNNDGRNNNRKRRGRRGGAGTADRNNNNNNRGDNLRNNQKRNNNNNTSKNSGKNDTV